jgi:cytochrome c
MRYDWFLAITGLMILILSGQSDAFPAVQAQSVSHPRYFSVFPFDDDFETTLLNPKWSWIREDSTHWNLAENPGSLRIITQHKDIWQDSNDAPLLLQSFTSDEYDIRTHVTLYPTQNHQQGGLVIYGDDDNYIRLTYVYIDNGQLTGPSFQFSREINGNFTPIQIPAPAGDGFSLRIVKLGSNFHGYYSLNGDDWMLIGTHSDVSTETSSVGLLAFNGARGTDQGIAVDFDYFQIRDVPFSDEFNETTLSPRWSCVFDNIKSQQ